MVRESLVEETWSGRWWESGRIEENSSEAMVVYGPKDMFHPQEESHQCDVREVSCEGLC